MIKIDKKTIPLRVLSDIKALKDSLDAIARKKTELIETRELDDWLFFSLDKDKNSSFYFRISGFEQNKSDLSKADFKVEIYPSNDSSLVEYKSLINSSKILEKYNQWINLIYQYNNIELTQEERFENQYEEEFIEYFEILDSDSEVRSFDLKQQLFLNDFMDYSVEILNESHEIDQEIEALILLAENLKQKIPVLSKKETVSYLSKFFAKARKKSIPLIKKLGKKFADEIIKRGITWSLDKGSEYLIGFFT